MFLFQCFLCNATNHENPRQHWTVPSEDVLAVIERMKTQADTTGHPLSASVPLIHKAAAHGTVTRLFDQVVEAFQSRHFSSYMLLRLMLNEQELNTVTDVTINLAYSSLAAFIQAAESFVRTAQRARLVSSKSVRNLMLSAGAPGCILAAQDPFSIMGFGQMHAHGRRDYEQERKRAGRAVFFGVVVKDRVLLSDVVVAAATLKFHAAPSYADVGAKRLDADEARSIWQAMTKPGRVASPHGTGPQTRLSEMHLSEMHPCRLDQAVALAANFYYDSQHHGALFDAHNVNLLKLCLSMHLIRHLCCDHCGRRCAESTGREKKRPSDDDDDGAGRETKHEPDQRDHTADHVARTSRGGKPEGTLRPESVARLRRCSKCRLNRYCSAQCMEQSWNRPVTEDSLDHHRLSCRTRENSAILFERVIAQVPCSL